MTAFMEFPVIKPVLIAAALLSALPALAQGTVAPAAAPMTDAQLVASFSGSPSRFTQQGGETLYRSICQACHMADGQGAKTGSGMFPALAGNPKLAAGAYPALVVMNGLHGMPPFGHQLSDAQIADVVNFVRTHFGNHHGDALTAQSVQALRPAKP
ncbi:MAG: hypothetical protein QG612_921 [Pseudomonadota bacterium]|jgi:mono/diheme cytochrome c family protein|nr:hypothetical protein [Pseudomonadota bacterium]